MKNFLLALVVFIIASIIVLFVKNQKQQTSQRLSFKIEQAASETRIFIEGQNIDDITVIEIHLKLTPEDAKIISATAGNFLGKDPLKVKWETKSRRFVLMKNPNNLNLKNNPAESIIALNLNSARIIEATSRVYLKGEKVEYLKNE